jgi:hypothetical protein
VEYSLFQGFIATLSEEQKDKLLLEILSNGKGSLDYAKNLVQCQEPPTTAFNKTTLVCMWSMPTHANRGRKQVLWQNQVHDIICDISEHLS